MQAETAETPDFDPIAVGESPTHLLDDGSDREIDVDLTQMLLLVGKLFYQLGLCHAVTP